jgi:hypothetical protein
MAIVCQRSLNFVRRLVAGLAACGLAVLLSMEQSCALEEIRVYRGALILEGQIGPGDYDKFRAFVSVKSNFDKINSGVFLASPGGSITQAIKIGRLIRALQLNTDAPSGPPTGTPKFGESPINPSNLKDPKNYFCASACFFLYVAGVYRNLNWVGRLGIHRPVQLESTAMKLDVNQSLNLTWQVRTEIKRYLKEMDVPDKYVDIIYSIPPNELRMITQSEYDTDLRGFVPEIKDKLSSSCGPQTFNRPNEAIKCWARIKTELSSEAWNRVFSRN